MTTVLMSQQQASDGSQWLWHSAVMIALQQPLNVMIVDDDDLLLEAVALMVEALECNVTTAQDGLAALATLREHRFDVVITDWQMPGLDGIGLVRELRAMQNDQYLHIVMMTTRSVGRTARDGLDAEVDDFLFKPIDQAQLELSIASARRSIDLQRRLARRNRHLVAAMERARSAYRRIRSDLDAATATQRSLLPEMQASGLLHHAWLFIPSQGVAGDSLDVRTLPDGRRFFFQIDVSGHGIPAALRAFSLHHRLAARPPDTVTVMQTMVAALNRDAQDEAEGAYYTMLCGLVAADGSRVDCIRAGHPMPIIVGPTGTRLSTDGNLPVGLVPGLSYQASSIMLAPGDRLIIHSDGLTDCRNRDGEEFGHARVEAFFAEQKHLPIASCMTVLEAELRLFRGPGGFDDDVSVLIFERSQVVEIGG